MDGTFCFTFMGHIYSVNKITRKILTFKCILPCRCRLLSLVQRHFLKRQAAGNRKCISALDLRKSEQKLKLGLVDQIWVNIQLLDFGGLLSWNNWKFTRIFCLFPNRHTGPCTCASSALDCGCFESTADTQHASLKTLWRKDSVLGRTLRILDIGTVLRRGAMT